MMFFRPLFLVQVAAPMPFAREQPPLGLLERVLLFFVAASCNMEILLLLLLLLLPLLVVLIRCL